MSPYNPKPTNEGGNRGIDIDFSRKAPKGKFRVIGVDTFDGGDWVSGDFDTLPEAKAHASQKTTGQQMLKMHIYNDQGKHLSEAGTF